MPKKNKGAFLDWRADRGVWEIIWYVKGKRHRRSTRTDDRERADQELTAFKERSRKRTVSRLVDDILADYQKEHAPHTARPEDIAYCVINLTPHFGSLTVEEVTKATCQAFTVKRKAEVVTDATIRKDLEILRAALNHDHREGRCGKSFYVWLPDKPEPRPRWLTRKEAATLIWAAKKVCREMRDKKGNPIMWHLPWFIVLSLYSGQRKEAVLALTWDRVDLERGLIDWQYGKRTNKRRPMQPMPDELKLFLRLIQRRKANGLVLSYKGCKIDRVTRSLATALRGTKIKDVTPHTLKHTALTWMLQNGSNPWDVAGFTGTSLRTIESTYGHHAPDYLESARSSAKRARQKRLLTQTQPQEKEMKGEK